MGRDKAFVRFKGIRLIQHSTNLLRQVTDDVRIIGDPAKYSFLGLRAIPDCIESQGPLSGIYTALVSSPTSLTMVLACDMPLMDVRFLNLLLERTGHADAIMMRFEDGSIEPLCAIYSKACVRAIETSLQQCKLKVSDFLNAVRVVCVSESELGKAGLDDRIFTNLNTPEEFERLLNRKAQ